MKALRFIGAALLAICVCQSSPGEERSAEQWQTLIDKEQPVAYDPEAGSILGSLAHFSGRCQVHMVYYSELPRTGELTIKFVRDNRDILTLKGHLYSVWVGNNDVLYFADFGEHSTGCTVVAYDLTRGKVLWRTVLQGIGPVGHSKYNNSVNMELTEGAICVRGYESFGSYVEIVDAKTGKLLAHRVFKARS